MHSVYPDCSESLTLVLRVIFPSLLVQIGRSENVGSFDLELLLVMQPLEQNVGLMLLIGEVKLVRQSHHKVRHNEHSPKANYHGSNPPHLSLGIYVSIASSRKGNEDTPNAVPEAVKVLIAGF